MDGTDLRLEFFKKGLFAEEFTFKEQSKILPELVKLDLLETLQSLKLPVEFLIKFVDAFCLIILLDLPGRTWCPPLVVVELLGLILLRTLMELFVVESNCSAMGDLLPMTLLAILSLLLLLACGFMLVDNLFT